MASIFLPPSFFSPALLGRLAEPLAQPAEQTGQISGIVRDSWQTTALGGVVVSVRGTTLAVTTDSTGRYLLEAVPVGEQVVVFSKSGFTRATVTEVLVGVGQTSTVDIQLHPDFYELEEYEVTAEDLFAQNEAIINF